MSTDIIQSNAFPSEGSATTTETVVNIPWKTRKVMITNDDDTNNLLYRFKTTLPQATLRPGETVALQIRQRTIYVESSTSTVPYRIQTLG